MSTSDDLFLYTAISRVTDCTSFLTVHAVDLAADTAVGYAYGSVVPARSVWSGYQELYNPFGADVVTILNYIHVSALRRKQGLGTRMLEDFCMRAKERGAARCFLYAAQDTEEVLIPFYEKRGFTVVVHPENCAACMVRELR